MEVVIAAVKQFIQEFFGILRDKLSAVSSDASAVILVVIAIGLLLLLAFIAAIRTNREKPSAPRPEWTPSEIDSMEGSPKLKNVIQELNDKLTSAREKIAELKSSPNHTPVEKFYFAANGIVNSGFILCIALLLWEFFSLRARPAKVVSLSAVSDEFGRLMTVLACTMLVSAAVVFLSKLEGRSYERINRAFFISFVIAMAALLAFALVMPHQI